MVVRSRAALLAGAALTLSTFAAPADAAFTFTMLEVGSDVVATGAGSLNLAALRQDTSGIGPQSGILPTVAGVVMSGAVTTYLGLQGPIGIGSGNAATASSSSGSPLYFVGVFGLVGVPQGYQSGSPLANSLTFAGSSFASLGVTPGTYLWTWGTGVTADSLTVRIGPASVPEPTSALVLGAGLLGLAGLRRK